MLKRLCRGRLVRRGPATLDQDAAAHRGTAGEAVDPADRERPGVGGGLERLVEVVDVADALALLQDPGRGHALHAQLHLEDVAGQAHAADGGTEEVALALGRAGQDAPVGHAQRQARDVLADAAGHVVVLAVHVGGHRAPERDELRPRRDRHEVAAREEDLEEAAQRQARLGAHHARLRVEREDAVGERGVDRDRLGGRGQRGVAVGASEPARERHAERGAPQVLGADLGAGNGNAAPTAEGALMCRHSAGSLRGGGPETAIAAAAGR
jgi:hypothetical protein